MDVMMKTNRKNSTWRRIAVVCLIVCLLSLFLAACGNRLSGTYVPEEPDNAGVLFDSIRFEGKTVHVETAGSSVGLSYVIKDGAFVFEDNLSIQIHGNPVPTSLVYTKLKDGTFWLGGIHYVPVN